LDLVLKCEDFRTLLEGLLNERENIQFGRGHGRLFLNELEILLIRIAKNGGKCGKRRLVIVASFEQQELTACQVNAGETQVQFGL